MHPSSRRKEPQLRGGERSDRDANLVCKDLSQNSSLYIGSCTYFAAWKRRGWQKRQQCKHNSQVPAGVQTKPPTTDMLLKPPILY